MSHFQFTWTACFACLNHPVRLTETSSIRLFIHKYIHRILFFKL